MCTNSGAILKTLPGWIDWIDILLDCYTFVHIWDRRMLQLVGVNDNKYMDIFSAMIEWVTLSQCGLQPEAYCKLYMKVQDCVAALLHSQPGLQVAHRATVPSLSRSAKQTFPSRYGDWLHPLTLYRSVYICVAFFFFPTMRISMCMFSLCVN